MLNNQKSTATRQGAQGRKPTHLNIKLHQQWVLFLGNIHFLDDPTRVNLAINRLLQTVLREAINNPDLITDSTKQDVELMQLLSEFFADLGQHASKSVMFDAATVSYKTKTPTL